MSDEVEVNMPENTPGTHATKASDVPMGISTKWKPGQSGNPGGRPRGEREVRELAQKHGPRAIKRLVALMDSDNPRVAVAAASAVLDRGYGKPNQSVSGPDNTPLFPPGGATRVIATAQQGAEFLAAFMADPGMDISGVTFAEPEPAAALPAISAPTQYIEHVPSLPVADEPTVADPFEPAPNFSPALWERLGQ